MARLRRAWRSLPPLLAMFFLGCGIPNPNYALPDLCKEFDKSPLVPLTAPDPTDPAYPKVPFTEQPGQIKVMHGYGVAKAKFGDTIVKVEQGVALPSYANRATVFLNGWRLTYDGGDQHVLALGAVITKINLDLRNQRLTWTAAGLLRDDGFRRLYELAYWYTVIAWNDPTLNLVVDHGSADRFCNADTDLPDKAFLAMNNGTTALSAFSVFAQNLVFPPNRPVAVLPRGFGFAWYDGDHHLLQLGYNLDYSEIFAEKGKAYNNNKNHVRTLGDLLTGTVAPLPGDASRVDSGFVSWNTYAILKDDANRRYYLFTEMTSTLGGNDVGLVQPPFNILPSTGAEGASAGGLTTKDFVIENVPFAFAVPILTGWEIAYLGGDEHVKELGIWIDDWSYAPGPQGGTLRYKLSSILRDDDSWPGHYDRHKVTVLGIRPFAGGGLLRQSP